MHYLERAANRTYRSQTVDAAVEFLRGIDFDTVVVSGVSGLLLGPIVAHLFGKKITVVRKAKDSCHSSNKIEGTWGEKYVIIDDFIETGRSVEHILSRMKNYAAGCECVGFYSYHPNEWDGMKPEAIAKRFQKAGVRFLNPPEPLPEVEPEPRVSITQLEPPNPRGEPTMADLKMIGVDYAKARQASPSQLGKSIWGMPKFDLEFMAPKEFNTYYRDTYGR